MRRTVINLGTLGNEQSQEQSQTNEPMTTVSPVMQNAVTPTISPIFSQVQDSPYAQISNRVDSRTATDFRAAGGGTAKEGGQGTGAPIVQDARDFLNTGANDGNLPTTKTDDLVTTSIKYGTFLLLGFAALAFFSNRKKKRN